MELWYNQQFFYGRPLLYRYLSVNIPVITVVAGTGFGKTSLVNFWLRQADTTPLYISLTELDDYKQHFWKSLSYAIAGDDLSQQAELLNLGFPDDSHTYFKFLKLLTWKIYKGKNFTIVLDNYHCIKNEGIRHFIEGVVLTNIESLNFIFISRSPVVFSYLTKYDVEIQGIGEDVLSFTKEEVDIHLRQRGIRLAESEMKTLFHYTNGWPLLVWLAMQALEQKNGDTFDRTLWELFEKDIYTILEKLVFEDYTSDQMIKITLLSLLDFFPEELAKEILQSGTLFRRIAEHLLICTDQNKKIYQFHDIFKPFFYDRMQSIDSNILKQTFIIAGDYFTNQGYMITPLTFYRRASAYMHCLEVLKRMMPCRLSAETGKMMMETIESFSADFKEQHPVLEVMFAATHFLTLDYKMIAVLLEKTIQKYYNAELTDDIRTTLSDAHIALALLNMLRGNINYKKHLEQAALYFNGKSIVFGGGFWLLNDGRPITLRTGKRDELDQWVITLHEAAYYLHTILDCAYGLPDLAQAEASYLRGNMEDALLFARLALAEGRKHDQFDIVCSSYALLNKIAVAQGKYNESMKVLEEMRIYLLPLSPPPTFHLPDIAQSWFYLKLRKLHHVSGWYNGEAILDHGKFLITIGIKRIIYAECLLIEQRYEEMLQELLAIEKTFTAINLFLPLVSVHILKAIVYDRLHDDELCRKSLEQVYLMTDPNDIIIPVIEYGKDILSVLECFKRKNTSRIPQSWLDIIETKAMIYEKNLNQIRREYAIESESQQDNLSLDPYEQKILLRLSDGESVKDIAQELYQSVSSIKLQVKRICLKLDAVNTAHAVKIAYARQLI